MFRLERLQQGQAPDATARNDSQLSDSNPPQLAQKFSEPDFDTGSASKSLASVYTLPENIVPLLKAGYSGCPIPASFEAAPQAGTNVPKEKIHWYGSWRAGWEPRWGSIRPQIQDIQKVVRPFLSFCGLNPERFSVKSFHQGMWNKLYLISSQNEHTPVITERIFRIPLPVNPWFKLQSEVATMEYVRKHTSIPVPKVYVFESSMNNPLGFEWMIMEKMEGLMVKDATERMNLSQKINLNTTIAQWVDQLSRLRFDQIGSLYREWDPRANNYLQFQLGPCVTDHFVGPWRSEVSESEISRGPFQDESEFYSSIVAFNLRDAADPRHRALFEETLAENDWEFVSTPTTDDGNDSDSDSSIKPTSVYNSIADFELIGVPKACFTALTCLSNLNKRLRKKKRGYILYHFDISPQNVLVDNNFAAIALLDWEHITTKSLSQIYPWPKVIDPKPIHQSEPSPPKKRKRKILPDEEMNNNAMLPAAAFMQFLRSANSKWPQAAGPDMEFKDEVEEDLWDLAHVIVEIYAAWGETEIFDRIMERYKHVFQEIPPSKRNRRHSWRKTVRKIRSHSNWKLHPT